MLIMRTSQLGSKLGQLFIAVWVLCQSMLLCAAGMSVGMSMPASHTHHGFPSSISSSLSPVDSIHSNHQHHAAQQNVTDSGSLTLMGESDITMTSTVTATNAADCCETEDPLPSIASLAPIVVLFALFWLIGALSRRETMPRSWLIHTVGYHHPRYHLVNCSFLN